MLFFNQVIFFIKAGCCDHGRGDQQVYGCHGGTGMLNIYNAMGCIYLYVPRTSRALLWKAEFAGIVTSCTRRYIPGRTGLCLFIAVPYYSMVCTAMEFCCPYPIWVYTFSCLDLKSEVESLNSMYKDKPWYIRVCTKTNLVHTVTNPWTVCTKTNLVHTSMYWDKPGTY